MTTNKLRRDDAGFTLVESAITMVVLAVALAAAVPIVTMSFRMTADVQNTYTAVDQLALASEVVTRYVHEAVANVSGGTPFPSATADTATFYTDTGNANGPVRAVAQVVTNGSVRSFKITLTPPVAGSCPTSASPNNVCAYGASPDGIVLINYLTNGTGGNPVFTYTLQGGTTCAGPPPGTPVNTLNGALVAGNTYPSVTVHPLTTAVAAGDPVVIGTGNTTQTVTASAAGAGVGATSIPVSPSFIANAAYASGTSVYDDACSAAQVSQITAVAINLQATKNPSGQPTGYQSLSYLLSPNFNLAVG
jgi:prepilin-type N-terminal cleavage/methylation domain-containing protein